MKTLILAVFSVMTLCAAEAPTATVSRPAAIPRGAVAVDANTYRFTDAQGKKWVYRKTPFGIARLEDRPEVEVSTPSGAGWKAFDVGDSVRFERPGPFGTYKWTTRKAELDSEERAVWERQQKHAGADGGQD